MKKNIKEFGTFFIDKLISVGIGWLIGLSAIKLMSNFFEKKSWSNIWGLWSDKIIIEKSTFRIGEWVLSIFIGFAVMKLVNKIIIPFILKNKSIKSDKF